MEKNSKKNRSNPDVKMEDNLIESEGRDMKVFKTDRVFVIDTLKKMYIDKKDANGKIIESEEYQFKLSVVQIDGRNHDYLQIFKGGSVINEYRLGPTKIPPPRYD